MIHRYIDLLEEGLDPIVVYMAHESATSRCLWLCGGLATPFRLGTTAGNHTLNDPMISPTAEEIIYCAFSGGTSRVRRVDMDDTDNTILVTSTGGGGIMLQPYWSPDGANFIYRRVTGSPGTNDQEWTIRRMDRDGTNDTLLHTYTPPAGAIGHALVCPAYSPSGEYICFGKGFGLDQDDELWVMDADGSNAQNVATANGNGASSLQWSTPYTYPSWQHNSDVLGWCELGAETGEASWWRKVNADGTGLTALLTTNHRASPAPQVQWGGSGRFCWLPDDSGMAGFKNIDGSAPQWRMAKIHADGSGESWIDDHRSYASFTGNPFGVQVGEMYRPAAFGERVYWTPGIASGALIDQDVVSIMADGSDLRTDDDGVSVSPAHGFSGFAGRTA